MNYAETALRWGLVREVVPHTQLLERDEALAARLCSSRPRAMRATKEIAIRGQSLPWGDAFRTGEAIRRLARAGASADVAEGLSALRERRPSHLQRGDRALLGAG